MSELPERLRKPLKGYPHGCTQSKTWYEAADRIEELTAYIDFLEREWISNLDIDEVHKEYAALKEKTCGQ